MLKISLGLAWRGLNHLTRVALVCVALVPVAAAIALLGLRYWVLPDIERYHDLITDSVSQSIGQPAKIGRIIADWDGLRPHLVLQDVHILDKEKRDADALVLPQVKGVLAWTTLLTGSVRLYSLEVEQPDLLVRRDAQGVMHIAGITLSEPDGGGNGTADWLLHQSHIVVRDARVTWLDEQHGAPALTFERLNLRIQNGGRRHRFAVVAVPPAHLSSRLDVRGDFVGESFGDLSKWRGRLYTRLDYVDVSAWRPWLLLPDGLRAHGALRGWVNVSGGQLSQATADLRLSDVQAQLGENLAPFDLRVLNGRAAWRKSGNDMEFTTRKLSLQTRNGTMLPPTDFYLRRTAEAEGEPGSGEVRANVLELADLAGIADTLPLDAELKKQIADFAPRGRIADLQAKWQDGAARPKHYEVRARFEQLALNRVGKVPGFSGLSGKIDGNDEKGTLSIDAHALTLDAPEIMPEALSFHTLSGQGAWDTSKQGMEVKFNNVSVANEDVAGSVRGSFKVDPGSLGVIDLSVDLTRVALNHAARYIPLSALGKETLDWLRDALVGGQADGFHLRLRGDLDDFPFDDSKKGLFQLQANIKDGVLQYDPAWPRIDGIGANLLLRGRRLEVNAPAASTLGMGLKKVGVVITDITSPDLRLLVRGEAEGETARGLDFIGKSPVRGYIDGFTDDVTARGNGSLTLTLDIPLAGEGQPKVAGSYRFIDNEIHLGDGVPVLYRTNGELLFTESSMRTRNVGAQVLGGPATIEVTSGADGAVQVKARGHADVEALRRAAPSPVLAYLHGGSDWNANVSVQKKQANVLVTANLVGLASDLPAPFDKGADENIPVRFEIRTSAPRQDVVQIQYGKLLSGRFLRREEGGDMVVKRGTVNFGGTGSRWVNRDGVWLTGVLPELSLDGWSGLLPAHGDKEAEPLSVEGADLTIQRLDVYGYSIDGLRVNARNQNGTITAQLAAETINGDMTWQPEGKGKLVARLRNLTLTEKEDARKPQQSQGKSVAGEDRASAEFPALDLAVDTLIWKGHTLGKMELLAQQNGRDWKLNSLRFSNPDGTLTLDGAYSTEKGNERTDANLKLVFSNAGKMMARFGYPDSIKNGSGTLSGGFWWPGAPDDFNYAALNGWLALDMDKGQFLKIDPGIGKLLGILSLQALPSRITLDFTDVFTEGMAFNGINGTAQVRQGVVVTDNFHIDGLSAKVSMQGQVDLNRETQNLRVRILPTVSNSVSVIGAFAAGPLVGLGTYVASKILSDPLDKLVSFEYNITGTWVNPTVTKAGQPADKAAN